jgi:predicted DNA-binding transcriptional regulator AlpA
VTAAARPPAVEAAPALMDAKRTALFLGMGRSTFYRMDETAQIPRCVYLGKMLRWSRAELEAWIAAGAPSRARWEAMKS